MAFPVRDVVRPASLSGQTNGRLAASILAETPGLAGGPGVLLVAPAARAWRALTAAAAKAGHTLKISHSNSAYRPYADQERIFRQRYVQYATGNERRSWPGHGYWWRRDGVAAAAVPGTSNHGWGLAVDVGEERDGDSGAESIDTATVAWLVDHEQRFGFSHEIQSEPWHIRYFTGDRIPQAVLDHEGGTTAPTPQQPTLEVDVIFHIEGSTYTFLHLGGREFLPLTEATFWKLAGQGVKVVAVSNDLFQSLNPVGNQGSLLHGKAYKAA